MEYRSITIGGSSDETRCEVSGCDNDIHIADKCALAVMDDESDVLMCMRCARFVIDNLDNPFCN